MNDLSFINKLPDNSSITKYLSRDELGMLIKNNKIIDFSDGDIILQQGKEAKNIYLILDGTVIVTAKLLSKGTTNLETLLPGSFLGEISYIEKVPCATSVTASHSVQCLSIASIYMEFISIYYPELKYKLLNAISHQVCYRLKIIHDKIISFIASADMAMKPFFAEIIHSLTRPAEIGLEEFDLSIEQLQKLPLFNMFDKDEIEALLENSTLLKTSKNCILIPKGESSACCYIVLRGAVQSSIEHNNKSAKLSVIGPATLFAGIACIDTTPSFTITFTTCEQAVLFKLSAENLAYFQQNKLILWYKLFGLICRSLVALEKSADKLDIRLNIETYNR